VHWLVSEQYIDSIMHGATIKVLYMFRATSCSSSGDQILLLKHLVTSLSVIGRPVHRFRENSQPVHRTATYRKWRYQMLY